MTVLAWLLLYATVIQLGQSNYSISSEDGTHEVNSYANNKFPFIDRSQIRRTRRSVDSDLEDAKTALGKAEEKLKTVRKELAQDKQRLIDLEKDLKEAERFSDEKEREYKNAAKRESQLKDKIADAVAALPAAMADYDTAKTAYDTKKEAWDKDEDAKRIEAEKTYNTTKNAKTKADGELVTAKSKASEMKDLIDKYDKEEQKKKEYDEKKKNLYEHNQKFVAIITTANENIVKNKVRENLREAEELNSKEVKKLLAIEKNGILNGDIQEDFGTKTLQSVYFDKMAEIGNLKNELKTKKGTPEAKEIQDKIDIKQSIFDAVKHLIEIDPTYELKKVVDVKQDADKIKTDAQKLVTAAATAVSKAQGELVKAQTAIDTAQAELNKLKAQGTTLDALKEAKEAADGALPAVKANIQTYTNELDTFSTANGGQKGPTEWAKLKTKLDGVVTAKTQARDAAIQAESAAQTDYTAKKKTADDNWIKIENNEKNKMEEKEEKKKGFVKERDDAQKEKDGLKDYYTTTKEKYNASQTSARNVKGLIAQQKELISNKEQNEVNAIKEEENARNALEDAKAKKAEAAQAEERKKEQAQSGALGVGLGVTASILVVIGVSAGIFLMIRRRRKQKKESEGSNRPPSGEP